MARTQATSSEVVGQLSPAYVDTMAEFVENSLRSGPSRPAVVLADLLANAAVQTQQMPVPSPARPAARPRTPCSLISTSPAGISSMFPTATCFIERWHSADRRSGLREPAGDNRLLSGVLHRLGTMYLDPYSVGRTLRPGDTSEYEAQHQRWLDKALNGATAVNVSVSGEETAMPQPVDAMRSAEDLLREAAALREGEERGRSLKAEAEAMLWRQFLGDPVDDHAMVDILQEALGDLAWDRDPQLRLTVLNALQVKGVTVDPLEIDRVFERSLDSWLRGLRAVLAVN